MVVQPDLKKLEEAGYKKEGDTLKSPTKTYVKDWDKDPSFRHTGTYSEHVLYFDKHGRVSKEVRQRPMITEESSAGAWRQERVRATEIRTYDYDTGQVSIRNPAYNITTFRQIAEGEKARTRIEGIPRVPAQVLKEEQRIIAGKQVTIKTLSQPTYLNVAKELKERQELKPKVTAYKTEPLRADQRLIYFTPGVAEKIKTSLTKQGIKLGGEYLEGLQKGSITQQYRSGFTITKPATYKLSREITSPYYPTIKPGHKETISFMNMPRVTIPPTKEYFPGAGAITLEAQSRNLDFIDRSAKAWEIQFYKNIEKQRYKYAFGGPLIYAGGSVFKGLSEFPASVMRTFRDPLREGLPVETYQFVKAVVTDPIAVGGQLIKKGSENPFMLAGELYGFKKGFEIISPIGPIKIEKVKVPGGVEKISETANIITEGGFSKPSAEAFSKNIKLGETPETTILKKIGFDLKIPNPFRRYRSYRLGDVIKPGETPVYVQPYSEGILGTGPYIPIPSKLAGLKINFDTIIEPGSGPLRVGATPSKLIVEYVNPKYLKYLEDNPLYADLMKTELKISKPSVEYERIIETGPGGEKIIKTIEKIKPAEGYRELDIDTIGGVEANPFYAGKVWDNVLKRFVSKEKTAGEMVDRFTGEKSSLGTLEPGGGGAGGSEFGVDLGGTPFQSLQLLTKKKSKVKLAYEEIILKPFQDFKTGRKTIRTPVTINTLEAVKPIPAKTIYVYDKIGDLKEIQIKTQINYQALQPDIKIGLGQKNILTSLDKTAQTIGQKSNLKQGLATTQIQSLSQAQSQTQTLRQAQSQTQSLSQAQAQIQSLSQAQSLKLRQAQIIKSQQISLTATKFSLSQNSPFIQGFDVFLRRRGKFRKVSALPLSKAEAISLGSFKAEHTAGATFKVSPTPGQATGRFYGKGVNLKRFYKKDNLFIEKTKHRISTAGELSEITFKGISTKKSKSLFKKKGKEKNPFGFGFKNIFGA